MEYISFSLNLCLVMELKSYVEDCSELFARELKLPNAFLVWIFLMKRTLCVIVLSCNEFEVCEMRTVGVYNCLFTCINLVLEDENII